MSRKPGADERHWLDEPRHRAWIVQTLYGLCALLLAADLLDLLGVIYHKHPHFTFEGWPGFYAVFGFSGSVVLVLVGKVVRRLLARKEGYYEP